MTISSGDSKYWLKYQKLLSPQLIQSDSCKSCEPPNPADRHLLKITLWLFYKFVQPCLWHMVFLRLIDSLIKYSVTCSPFCLVFSIRPDQWNMNNLWPRIRLTLWCTLHEQFELQRNHLSSPWKESQSQSLVPSMERLQSQRGRQGQGQGRRRGLARASSCPKLLWRLRLHVWPFCSTLILQNRKGRAKLPDTQGLLQGQP